MLYKILEVTKSLDDDTHSLSKSVRLINTYTYLIKSFLKKF